MGRFKGKRTKRHFFTNKKPSVLQRLRQAQCSQSLDVSPFKSPNRKKIKHNETPRKKFLPRMQSPKGKSPFKVCTAKYPRISTPRNKSLNSCLVTPKKSKRKLIHVVDHDYAVSNQETNERNVSFNLDADEMFIGEASESSMFSFSLEDKVGPYGRTLNDTFEFTALESMDESFEFNRTRLSETTHFRENYELFIEMLENLKENDLRDEFISFFQLVKDGRFPLNNVAFRLFLDVVKWYSCEDSRGMRYDETTLNFFWLGKKLFGGKFLRFMSGPKNETDLLVGKENLSPSNSKINFACPSRSVIGDVNPLGMSDEINEPGVLTPMIDLKAQKNVSDVSYVLMFDGKKIKRGADADLLGFESGQSLKERESKHQADIKTIDNALSKFKEISRETSDIAETDNSDTPFAFSHICQCLKLFSNLLHSLRLLQTSKRVSLGRLKDKCEKDPSQKKTFEFAIDCLRTSLYRIDNCLKELMDSQWTFCKAGACLNHVADFFAKGKVIDISTQKNVRLLKSVEEMKLELGTDDLEPRYVKQRSPEWFDARTNVKVTGSTVYSAIGCDGLKKQLEHFDSAVSKKPKQISPAVESAMTYGTACENHQIATLSSVIMPVLFPDLVYYEEGYYINNDVIVSPDGSLRTKDKESIFAFEAKAPVEKQFTTRLHYSVPDRYVTQTLFEGKVLNAKKGTLYLCWTPESTSVFIVPENENLMNRSIAVIDELYGGRILKRPCRLLKEVQPLKQSIKEHSLNCEFIGEFPSVRASATSLQESVSSADNFESTCSYDDLIRALLKAKNTLIEAYNLQRVFASQVVVYLLADLNRLWKPEEPHAVPVMYFYRGYSLSMDIARKLTEHCKEECQKKGLDVVVTSSDGEFINLIVRDKKGEPLTLYQLSKDVWSEVCRMKKSEIVKKLQNLNKEFRFEKIDNDRILVEMEPLGALVVTPTIGWKKKTIAAKTNEAFDINESEANDRCENSHIEDENVVADAQEDLDRTLPYDFEEIMSEQTNQNSSYKLNQLELSDIMFILRDKNREKWRNIDLMELENILISADRLNHKLLKAELLEIGHYLNLKLAGSGKELKVKNVTKVDLVNELSHFLGDNKQLEQRKRKKRSNLKSLKELASSALMKKSYPKQVLNIAYARHIWPKKVSEWRQKGRVGDYVTVKGTEEGQFQPYYLPEYNEGKKDFSVFTYDKTHLGTNLRKCICLNKVEGISVKAWNNVCQKHPEILHPSVIEVSPEGKINDQMKEKLARTMVSEKVENKMTELGYPTEAQFCKVIREGLYFADDKPGISSINRCNKRLALIKWLAKDVDFGSFPPYGSRIKGLSWVLYEGLRSSQEAKLYLYALSKSGTYCVRAPNTLCSESFFGSMQEMDPWGQGILSKSGVEKHISDFTTITAMKMQENRNIFIKTKADAAYPVPKVIYSDRDDRVQSDTDEDCTCRLKKFIDCIVPRDHYFDTEERARLAKDEKPYVPGMSGQLKGEQPIRSQYSYKLNEARMLPSKLLAISEQVSRLK